MLKDIFFIDAFASGGASRGRGRIVRDVSQRRRGRESMSSYYRRLGQSALGATNRTAGRLASIRPSGQTRI